ncbi:insulin receptor substrate 1-like [Apodemus sylvaticus]|uniref:insulin receptor substrate 1-like n=1 Tax=Apodemus sylvaticus TaxID=10129 RepID=UPI002243D2E6|nr:insulin receptor substrate 1-like [Apodemus sylvaticus]
MNPAGTGPTVSPGVQPTDVSLGSPFPWPCPPDVRLCGHLRKQKSQRRRFFVLRVDPPRLECYESEKKFLASGCRPPRPRRTVSLEGACTISKRADARQRHLIVIYTSDSSLGVAAASEAEQQAWYSALLEVRATAAAAAATAMGFSPQEAPESWIFAPFQDVWPVTLRSKGLGRARGLNSGSYRLCLGSGALSLLRKPGSKVSRDSRATPPPALRLSLLSVRRCGHADSFFFLELGRSAPMGPGELWLQAPDAVVAQSIHETVLAAMRRLGSDAAGGNAEPPQRDPPNSVPAAAPIQAAPYETPASSAAQARSPGERGRQDCFKPLQRMESTRSSRGADLGGDYITMGVRSDYVHMAGAEAGDYMWMAPPGLPPTPPPGLPSTRARTGPSKQLEDSESTEYVPMNRFFPGSLYCELKAPESELGHPGAHCSIGGTWRPPVAQPRSSQGSELSGDYMYIPDCVGTDGARLGSLDSCLNYVDLDLVPPLEVPGAAPGNSPHSYASIKF